VSDQTAKVILDLPDEFLDTLVDRLAERLGAQSASPPWMNFDELVEYTRIPEGTLRKLTASGQVPGHGARTKTYHRDEVDEALLGYSRKPRTAQLRRVS
jgi:hypothetical protein